MANPLSLLPPPFNSSISTISSESSSLLPTTTTTTTPDVPPQLITQGAEALLFRTTFLTCKTPCALKLRPRKAYRHPTLDARLTRQRLLAEARVLVRCRRLGVSVPAVLGVDWDAGWIACEWITGKTVRQVLDGRIRDARDEEQVERDEVLRGLMRRVGGAVGGLHAVGVVHGDLTTSNLMVRGGHDEEEDGKIVPDPSSTTVEEETSEEDQGEVVIIDFGLGVQSVQDEDRAVDLYVLERAFVSTHPLAEGLFQEVLKAYSEAFKGGKVVLKKLEEVRQRGRKKSMLG